MVQGQPHMCPWVAPWRAAEILLNEKMAICSKWTRFISDKGAEYNFITFHTV